MQEERKETRYMLKLAWGEWESLCQLVSGVCYGEKNPSWTEMGFQTSVPSLCFKRVYTHERWSWGGIKILGNYQTPGRIIFEKSSGTNYQVFSFFGLQKRLNGTSTLPLLENQLSFKFTESQPFLPSLVMKKLKFYHLLNWITSKDWILTPLRKGKQHQHCIQLVWCVVVWWDGHHFLNTLPLPPTTTTENVVTYNHGFHGSCSFQAPAQVAFTGWTVTWGTWGAVVGGS